MFKISAGQHGDNHVNRWQETCNNAALKRTGIGYGLIMKLSLLIHEKLHQM